MQTSTGNPDVFAAGDRRRYLSLAGARLLAYWIFTLLVAFEMMAGGVWDLLRIEYVRVILAHLGYPLYLLTILGVWKIPCALAILVPRFLRLKEWAYAGAFFTYTGAFASHLLAGDGADFLMPPLILAILTFASWAMRPPERWLTAAALQTETPLRAWVVPVTIAVIFLILAFITLPSVPPGLRSN